MTERAFWNFIWLAAFRLPWKAAPNWPTALFCTAYGFTVLVYARYFRIAR